MTMLASEKNLKQNRWFAILLCIVFGVVFVSSKNQIVKAITFFLVVLFVAVGFLIPKKLNSLRLQWLKLGSLLSLVTSPLFISIFYFFIFAPFSVVIRLFKANNFGFKNKQLNTYWTKSADVESSMRDQF